MEFELIEPINTLFKDEVRKLGIELGIPEHLVGDNHSQDLVLVFVYLEKLLKIN